MMRYIQYAWLALFLPSISFGAIDLDVDKNGATDVNRGGSNATTAAGARSNLGLGNVTNTSDANKPVSTAQQSALDLKSNITCFVDASAFNTCFGLDWITAAGISLGTTDNVTFGNITASGGTLTVGVGGTTQGTLVLKTNTDPVWTFGLAPAASPSAIVSLKAPGAMPTADNSLLNFDINGTGGWTDPATFLTPSGVGGALTVTATGFDGNLATTDNTLQEIAQKVDDLVLGSGGGYSNLTEFVAQTAWRLFYSDVSGDVKELALGSDGEYLKSNGAAVAPSWATPSGAAHDAVTLGTANGLSLSTQALSLGLASTSATGALNSTDWNTFNNKVSYTPAAPGAIGGTTPAAATFTTVTAASFSTSAVDGSRRSILPSNTTIAPTGGGVVEIYNEAGAIKAVENNTEYDVLLSRDIGGAVQAYDADLAKLAAPTAWRVFYSNGSSVITEVALGADGTYLRSNGATSAPSFTTPAGGGMATTDIDTSDELRAILTDEVGTGAAYFVGGALGTPASATLTNATGLPVAGITASTATAIGVGTVELGHASDTTIARSAAGVVTIEGIKIAKAVASGTSALGTAAIASGACATAVTTTATGTATTDVIDWGFNGDPTGVVGYQASANGMLTVVSYPSTNNVSFKVCNNTAASITPGAVTLNWRVIR